MGRRDETSPRGAIIPQEPLGSEDSSRRGSWGRRERAAALDGFVGEQLTIVAAERPRQEDREQHRGAARREPSERAYVDLEPLARTIRRPILFTNGSRDIMTPPRLAPSGFSAQDIVDAVPDWARLYEFPTIGHADLLEAPDEAVQVVTAFFHDVLEQEARG